MQFSLVFEPLELVTWMHGLYSITPPQEKAKRVCGLFGWVSELLTVLYFKETDPSDKMVVFGRLTSTRLGETGFPLPTPPGIMEPSFHNVFHDCGGGQLFALGMVAELWAKG